MSNLSGVDDYQRLKAALAGRSLPLALVSLDALEANARSLLERAGSLPVRLCSKSVRCVGVLRHVMRLSPRFRGLLCYGAREAAWLSEQGFDDLLVAYPTVDAHELDAAALAVRKGATITLMVDDAEQLPFLAQRARLHDVVLRVAIDLDLSTTVGLLHFGVRRSPVNGPEAALKLARAIADHRGVLELVGLMGYEAQLAGVQDAVAGEALRSGVLRGLKALSNRTLQRRRVETVHALREAGFSLPLVNGGGTGSLERTREDPSVTELAAGSGLYSPTLFDQFRDFRGTPALFFALPITRRPSEDIVTCSFGGYVASGPAGLDRLPMPVLPAGSKLLAHEGAGEVQTPVQLPKNLRVALGDPLFFRPAKAGELAERFTRFLLLRNGEVVDETATYRGAGQCFF